MARKGRSTIGYGKEKEENQNPGVQITIRLSASVYRRINDTRKSLGLEDFNQVFSKAISVYYKIIELLVKDYRIFAYKKSVADGINLDPGVTASEEESSAENLDVIAEMHPRFQPEILKQVLAIQEIIQSQTDESIGINGVIAESITVLNWVVAKRIEGKEVFAAKSRARGAIELPFDSATLRVKRSSN